MDDRIRRLLREEPRRNAADQHETADRRTQPQ